MALVNIDTEKFAQALVAAAAEALPGILKNFTQDLEASLADLLQDRTITIQVQLGDSKK
jgi:hypothetical protein